jgi:tetratricopeptide (TPR) repeat protein
MRVLIILLSVVLFLSISCSKEGKRPEEVYASLSQLEADSLIRTKLIMANEAADGSKKADLYFEAAEIATAKEKYEQAVAFYQEFLISSPNDQQFEEVASKMATILKEKLDKESSAAFLEAAIAEKFNKGTEGVDLKAMLNQQFEAAYPRENAPPVRNEIVTYVDACEIYAMFHPDDQETSEILYKAAEYARILQSYPKALMLYDWIIEKYPQSDRAPQAFFLKAFTWDDNMKNYREAGELYRQFIEQYPDNEFADDAQFLLENLGKTDEEILQNLTQ